MAADSRVTIVQPAAASAVGGSRRSVTGAGALSLLIVGVGLALVSQEARRDESVLTSVGAFPAGAPQPARMDEWQVVAA